MWVGEEGEASGMRWAERVDANQGRVVVGRGGWAFKWRNENRGLKMSLTHTHTTHTHAPPPLHLRALASTSSLAPASAHTALSHCHTGPAHPRPTEQRQRASRGRVNRCALSPESSHAEMTVPPPWDPMSVTASQGLGRYGCARLRSQGTTTVRRSGITGMDFGGATWRSAASGSVSASCDRGATARWARHA
jgi:hypothetical protein